MSYRRLSKKLFRSFTGLTVSEFDYIYEEIESKYEEYERTRRQCISEEGKKKKRKRGVCAGRPFKLKARERLLMLLVYYRLYITYTLSGFLLDLDQSNVCRDLCILYRIISNAVCSVAKEIV